MLNEFYPVSDSFKTSAFGQVGFIVKISGHLENAKRGDRNAESKLCNRLGQIRRMTKSFNELTYDLQGEVKKATLWLRSQGRVIDYADPDPRAWISNRQGKPRW